MGGDDHELLAALGEALRTRPGPGPAPERIARLRARVRTSPLPRRGAEPPGQAVAWELLRRDRPDRPDRPEAPPAPPPAVVISAAPTIGGATPEAPTEPPLRTEVLDWLRPRWRPALRYGAVAAVAGVLLGAAGGMLAARGDAGLRSPAPVTEFDGPLESATDRTVTGRATITRTGAGRTVRIEDGELADLPEGQYYEAWLIGPNDTTERPERISAGTFRPDDQGYVGVNLSVAVDPARYPDLMVTAEPADGDPTAGTTVVRRARLRPN